MNNTSITNTTLANNSRYEMVMMIMNTTQNISKAVTHNEMVGMLLYTVNNTIIIIHTIASSNGNNGIEMHTMNNTRIINTQIIIMNTTLMDNGWVEIIFSQ